MTSENRQERIKYLRRQEDRKRRLGDFLSSLSTIAGRQISEEAALSVDETDRLLQRIYYGDSRFATYSFNFPFNQADMLRQVFAVLRPDLASNKCYFTTDRFFKTFFIELDVSFAIDTFEKIIDLDTNTFYIYDKDLNNGLLLDSNEQNWTENNQTKYLWTYELRTWGKDWVDKIHEGYNSLIS